MPCSGLPGTPDDVDRFLDTRSILRDLGLAWWPGDRLVAGLENALGVRRLEDICAGACVTRANADVPAQIRDVLAGVGVTYAISDVGDAAPSRQDGPLIFYCNHPYGIADALIALELALARRPDTKVLANRTLSAFDLNTAYLIWVDPFTRGSGSALNRQGMRDALKHLHAGGALLMFPAGVCSHLHLSRRRITDPGWSDHLSRFIASTGASAVPIHFGGHNSWPFQI